MASRYRPEARRLQAWLCAEPATRLTMMAPPDAVDLLAPLLVGDDGRPLPNERVVAVCVQGRHAYGEPAVLSVGSARHAIVDPAEIYRFVLSHDRVPGGVVIAHQHPSGDPSPSSEDLAVTRRIVEAGRVMGVPLLDHIIVGECGRWVSLAERGHITSTLATTAIT